MSHFAILGSHPRLSLAELRSVLPQNTPPPTVAGSGAVFDSEAWDGATLMERLGGTVKLGDIIGDIPRNGLSAAALADLAAPLVARHSIDFGLTAFGQTRGTRSFAKLPIDFKKELKRRGIASRWVTGKGGEDIAPAAVSKLRMTDEGLDLCLFIHGDAILVGKTTHVQDADAWSLRDYGRPVRDERVGMLPPKLARIMVNLAEPPRGGTLLDPFCGGGTVLMEATLATGAARLIGSDIDATQISNAKRNLAWLVDRRILKPDIAKRIEWHRADARDLPPTVAGVDCVVTEGYLGPPLNGRETQPTLTKTADEITTLWRETLASLRPRLNAEARLVCVWPAFKTTHGTARVGLDAEIPDLGYELTDPLGGWEKTAGPLLYMRPGQRVMRRIVVLRTVR